MLLLEERLALGDRQTDRQNQDGRQSEKALPLDEMHRFGRKTGTERCQADSKHRENPAKKGPRTGLHLDEMHRWRSLPMREGC